MKIIKFGVSRKLDEMNKNDRIGRYIILPDSKFKAIWNTILITLLIYTATFTPFKVAFMEDD